jgi:hypothetical protein
MSKQEEADAKLTAALEKELAGSGHPVLTTAEIEAARAEARAAVDKARKAAAIKAIIADETIRLKREEGLVSGSSVNDEMVKVTIDLPEYSNSIILNQEPFYHGNTYTLPRHVAASFKEIMQRAWAHQEEIDGKSLAQSLQTRRDTVLTPTFTKNAPAVSMA